MALARIYLLAYNGASFVLWAALLGYTLGGGPATTVAERVAAPPPPLLTATQTLALVEIAHAAGGLVRAAPAATALQVGGKNLVVWTVMVPFWDQLVFPAAAASSSAVGGPAAAAGSAVSRAGLAGFLGCILTWSASEMVRFGYFAVQLARGREPFGWLMWLRWVFFPFFCLLFPFPRLPSPPIPPLSPFWPSFFLSRPGGLS